MHNYFTYGTHYIGRGRGNGNGGDKLPELRESKYIEARKRIACSNVALNSFGIYFMLAFD